MNRLLTLAAGVLLAIASNFTPTIAVAQSITAQDTLKLPHRQTRIEIDGDLSDWKGPCLLVELSDPKIPAPLKNSGTFRLVWDSNLLWFAVTIEDSEVFPPPETVTGSACYQWDSIEIYIDGHGNRSTRMDENDTQLIVACDGRNGAMHGDEMLHNVENWVVPKRNHHGLAVHTAARRTDTGYVVEGAFPLSAVDVVQAQAGQILALDLAWNDWIEDHPRLPELQEDLENLAAIFNNDPDLQISDPDSLGWDGWVEWENRAYRPYAWRTAYDFGDPTKWQLVKLVGKPPLTEALIARWGLVPMLVATFLLLLIGSLMVDLRLRRRYQVRVRELMTRIEAFDEPTVSTAKDIIHQTDSLANRLATAPTPGPDSSDTLNRVLMQISNNLHKNLSVADLSSSVGVSTRTLQRICQDEMGATPREVILAVKMRSAHEALRTGKWRVREVADQVGFDSPYHFSRRFKDFYGQPPSTFIPSRKAK